jgi:hypothetical protein
MTVKKTLAGVRHSSNKESNTGAPAFSEQWLQKLLNNNCFVGCMGGGEIQEKHSHIWTGEY